MRGTLRAQGRARSFRRVRLGFLVTSRAPQNTPRVPLKGTRGVLHRAILTEKCHLNPTQHAPTTRYAPGARSQATGACREISGTVPNLTLDDTAEYHADSDSGSDDDDPADGQLSD